MPESNLELVRSQWAPFVGLDACTVDWGSEPGREMLLAVADPEIELRWSANWAGEPLDFTEAGERVPVPKRQWGIGKTSGVPVEIEVTWVYELRDELIVHIDEYDRLDEACAAAGLDRHPRG